MYQYLEAIQCIMDAGEDVSDRTGVGTRTIFGYQMRFDLVESFPAVTTKKLAWKSVVGELLWFLEGSTSDSRLAEITHGDKTKNTIWTANANKQGKALGYTDGELGPVYGSQWRNWKTHDGIRIRYVDQIAGIIDQIKNDPDSRRIILNAWNVGELDAMTLPPCHTMCQFRVTNGKLSCQLYQRSADMFLGVPFNIASYSLLTHMLAQICKLRVGEFIWTGGDCHIYQNHFDQVQQQLERTPSRKRPMLIMPAFDNLDELLSTQTEDYKLIGYNPMPTIKAPMAV
jgi:thymidylate synthase